MNKDDNFVIEDCVKFKQDLHEKSYKASGAKNFNEYIEYVNKAFVKSTWCKTKGETKIGEVRDENQP
jgi:hypothetical protein